MAFITAMIEDNR